MGLDPLWAIILWIVIMSALYLYRRYVATNVVRSPDFERYCAGRPLVLALFSPNDASKVLDHLRSLLDSRGRVDNFRGVNPWPHYRFRVEFRRVDDHVVGVYLAGCAPRRGDRPPLTELSTALAHMLESSDLRIDQFWVHPQFYPGASPAEAHSEEGWQGRLDEERGLLLSRASEPPLWLRPALTSASAPEAAHALRSR